MAIVRLEFDLDSEVYPELHAALSGVLTEQARAERFRQLAASGLVWEKVRIQGPALLADPVESATPPPRRAARKASPAVAERAPTVDKRPAPRHAAWTASPAGKARDADFVDLAISAEPPASSLPPPARTETWPSPRDLEQVVRELPVLMDVVADVDASNGLQDGEDLTSRVEPFPHAALEVEARRPSTFDRDDDAAEASMDETGDVVHVTALAQKPATRSRLMRMKERGLFKNG
jgi:hypothetical protein